MASSRRPSIMQTFRKINNIVKKNQKNQWDGTWTANISLVWKTSSSTHMDALIQGQSCGPKMPINWELHFMTESTNNLSNINAQTIVHWLGIEEIKLNIHTLSSSKNTRCTQPLPCPTSKHGEMRERERERFACTYAIIPSCHITLAMKDVSLHNTPSVS